MDWPTQCFTTAAGNDAITSVARLAFFKFDFVRRYFLVFVVFVVFVVWLAFLEVTAAGLPAALQRWRWGSRRRSDMAEWKRSISH